MILASEGHFDGPVTLTAGAAVTFDDIAGIASELTDRDIRRVVVDHDKWVAEQVAHGHPGVPGRGSCSGPSRPPAKDALRALTRSSATYSAVSRARCATLLSDRVAA